MSNTEINRINWINTNDYEEKRIYTTKQTEQKCTLTYFPLLSKCRLQATKIRMNLGSVSATTNENSNNKR